MIRKLFAPSFPFKDLADFSIVFFVGIWPPAPLSFLPAGFDGPSATGKAIPAEKPVEPENGVELSKEELIRRKREEFIQKHGKGMDKSR